MRKRKEKRMKGRRHMKTAAEAAAEEETKIKQKTQEAVYIIYVKRKETPRQN